MRQKSFPRFFWFLLAFLVLIGCSAPLSSMTPDTVVASTVFVTPSRPAVDLTQSLTPSPSPSFGEISRNWRVAYFDEKSREICVVNGDGNNRECLDLNDSNFLNGYPAGGFLALAPDGNRVAYATECNIYIWTVGEKVRSIRNDGSCGIFRELQWSPDGNFITYISEELQRTCPVCQAYFGDVFIDSLDGSVHRALTADLFGLSHYPVWSPDGKSITFALQPVIQDGQNNYVTLMEEIYLITSAGHNPVNLTNHYARDLLPQWSPDGQWIAFLSDRGASERFDLYLMSAIDSRAHKSANLALKYEWPDSSHTYFWLPDGRFILYDDTLIDTVSGNLRKVTLPFVSEYSSWQIPADPYNSSATPH